MERFLSLFRVPVVSLAPLVPAVSEFGQVGSLWVIEQGFVVSVLGHLVVEIAPFAPGIAVVVLVPRVGGLL